MLSNFHKAKLDRVHLMRGHRLYAADYDVRRLDVVVFRDSLAVGPAHTQRKAHRRKRRQFFAEISRAHATESVADDIDVMHDVVFQAAKADKQLVFYVSPDPNDILCLWLLSDLLVRGSERPHLSCVWIGEHEYVDIPTVDDSVHDSDLVSSKVIQLYAECWKYFASGDLTNLATMLAACERRVRICIEELLRVMLARKRDSRVLLSDFDTRMLDLLSDGEPRYNYRLVGTICSKWPWIPDLFVFHRLSSWRKYGITMSSEGRWNRQRYGLTDLGSEVLQSGVHDFAHIPTMSLGGAMVYSLGATCRGDDDRCIAL